MENFDPYYITPDDIRLTAELLMNQGLTREEAIAEVPSRLDAEIEDDNFDYDENEDNGPDGGQADNDDDEDDYDGLTRAFNQNLNYFGTEWFDTQWHEVDGYFDSSVVDPFDDISDIDPPTFGLTDKNWTPEEMNTRPRELCRLDLKTFDEADLAALHEHLIRVDEALRQIINFWPTKSFRVHGQWIRAIVIPPRGSLGRNKYERTFHVEVAGKLLRRHTHIRALVQERSRPHVRPLNLNSIPHEIVGRIVDCCSDWPEKQRKKALKALRLTCRATEAMASRHLFEGITIHPTRDSLARLDRISRHPHLNKGIMTARISVACYRRSVAQSWTLFGLYLNACCPSVFYERDEVGRETSCHIKGPAAQTLQTLMDKWTEWQNFAADDDLVLEYLFRQSRFTTKVFEAYQKNNAEYEAVLEGGGFVNTVSDAMARMPHIKNLTISDHMFHGMWAKTYRQRARYQGSISDIFKVLAGPMAWRLMPLGQLDGVTEDLQATSLVPELLSALGSRGVSPTNLRIYLTMPDDIAPLRVPDDLSREHLGSFVQNVESLAFAIRHDRYLWPEQPQHDMEGLDSFLDQLLGSENLSVLNLDLESLAYTNQGEGGWHLPSLMKMRPRLRDMALSNVSLDSGKLRDFLGERPLYISRLFMPHVEVGTWTEVLDIMRERYDVAWSQTDSLDNLKGLSIRSGPWNVTGAERDEMEDDDYQRTFGDAPDGHRLAEKYIRRELDDNPCRPYV